MLYIGFRSRCKTAWERLLGLIVAVDHDFGHDFCAFSIISRCKSLMYRQLWLGAESNLRYQDFHLFALRAPIPTTANENHEPHRYSTDQPRSRYNILFLVIHFSATVFVNLIVAKPPSASRRPPSVSQETGLNFRPYSVSSKCDLYHFLLPPAFARL